MFNCRKYSAFGSVIHLVSSFIPPERDSHTHPDQTLTQTLIHGGCTYVKRRTEMNGRYVACRSNSISVRCEELGNGNALDDNSNDDVRDDHIFT